MISSDNNISTNSNTLKTKVYRQSSYWRTGGQKVRWHLGKLLTLSLLASPIVLAFSQSALALDYGDAPDTGVGTGAGNYQTTIGDGGPSQTVDPTLRLGTESDDDLGNLANDDADADDLDGTDDEDAVEIMPYFSDAAGLLYTIPVSVTHSSGSDAFLRGYIDFNQDGTFDDTEEESVVVTVPSSGTNPQVVQLEFTSPSGLAQGTTYARLRLSSVQTDVESPIGASTNIGEVEDYTISISEFGTPPHYLVRLMNRLLPGVTILAMTITIHIQHLLGLLQKQYTLTLPTL